MPRLTFVCSALLLLAFPLTAAADEFRAGVAVTDITPPVPYRMCGYFEERVSTGVKDPLLAKAVVFEQGDTSAALVFCDLIGVPREISAAARCRRARRPAFRRRTLPSRRRIRTRGRRITMRFATTTTSGPSSAPATTRWRRSITAPI